MNRDAKPTYDNPFAPKQENLSPLANHNADSFSPGEYPQFQHQRGRGGRGGNYHEQRGNYRRFKPYDEHRVPHASDNNRNRDNSYPNQNGYAGRGPPSLHHHRQPRPFLNVTRGRGHPYNHNGLRHNNGSVRHNMPPHHHRPDGDRQNQEHEKDSPWMTPELLKLIHEKEEFWKMCNESRSEENHRNFKIKRFEVNMAVNDAKILFYKQNPQFGQYSSYTQVFRRTVKKPEFYCDPCEKEFISQEQLDEHKTEHITCKLDGCTYTAHVKLVMKHIELQHSTNLFQRLKGYDTPEGIEKWKQERRKNFPTPENTARKKAEIAERKARGDIFTAKEDFPGIETFRHKIVPDERKSKNYGAGYQSDGDDEFRMRPGTAPFTTLNKSPAVRLRNFYTDVVLSNDGTLVGSTREIWMHNGDNGCNEFSLSRQKTTDEPADEDKEFAITDDEDDSFQDLSRPCRSIELPCEEITKSIVPTSILEGDVKITENTSCTAITSQSKLAGIVGYELNSESEMEEEDGEIKSDEEVGKITKIPISVSMQTNTEIKPSFLSDDEAPDEIPISKEHLPSLSDNAGLISEKSSLSQTKDSTFNNSKVYLKSGKQSSLKKQTNKPNVKPQTHMERAQSVRRKYTLLQRLLAPDIRREKNMVLQVVRFLVDRNFLDPINPKSAE